MDATKDAGAGLETVGDNIKKTALETGTEGGRDSIAGNSGSPEDALESVIEELKETQEQKKRASIAEDLDDKIKDSVEKAENPDKADDSTSVAKEIGTIKSKEVSLEDNVSGAHKSDEALENGDAQSIASSESEDDRGNWGSQFEFILSCLGFAVGYGNVWRFPYLCYKNGGAVFLIPYFIMLFCAGLPMFFMELGLGQYVGLGPNLLYRNMAPLFAGLGVAMPLISYYVSTYFDVIIAWSLYYTFSSFRSELPWGSCDNDFNSKGCATPEEIDSCAVNGTYYYDHGCLNLTEVCAVSNYTVGYNISGCVDANNVSYSVTDSLGRLSSSEDFYRNGVLGVGDSTWENFGSIQWELVGCLFLGWILAGAGLINGVKSTGKAIYFTALFPYVVLTILLGVGLSLDGSDDGIRYYFLDVDVSKLGQAEVWTDASSQIFYSLGSAFGSLVTLASYNKFSTNCMRDALIISILNCLTSVFAGFVLFSILGSLAYELGVPVSEVVSSGSGLAFIAYPQAVLNIPPPQLWSILFFIMFISIGMSSQFAMVETVNTAIYDQWPSLRQKKPYVVVCVCFSMFLLGLPMCFQGGVFLFELMNLYAAGISVIILAVVEIILVQYIYGHSRYLRHITDEIGIHIPLPLKFYWKGTWLFVTPVSLIAILTLSLIFWVPAYWGDYLLPHGAQVLGWLITFSPIALLVAVGVFVAAKGDYKGRALLQSSDMICPAHERRRRAKEARNKARHAYVNQGLVRDETMEKQHRVEDKKAEAQEKKTDF